MSESERRTSQGAEYENVDTNYMDQRQLQWGAAGWVLLAGLGVAYVISGDFAGWHFGLAEGGWGGLLIATMLMATMYTAMVFWLAELSSTIPTAGGGYGFARRALGPWGGFMTGTAILIEYAIAPAAIATFIGGYVESLIGIGGWVVYLAVYLIFVGIHLYGVGEALKLMFVITAIAVVALAAFIIGMIPQFDPSNLFDIDPTNAAGASSFLPFGLVGIWAAFPFAIWFFLAIEGVPLAAEESRDPTRDMPRGLIAGMTALLLFAVLILVFGPGAAGLGGSRATRCCRPIRAASGAGGGLRRRQRARHLRQHRGSCGPDRQLLLDHLRLLAPDVRALKGRLSAEGALAHGEPQDAVGGADSAWPSSAFFSRSPVRTGRP